MSLRFLGKPRTIGSSTPSHSGPIRGMGSYHAPLRPGTGPKRGRGAPPVHKEPVYEPLKPSRTVSYSNSNSTKTTAPVPMRVTPEGTWEFVGHDGPQRGIGLGPGAIYHRAIYKPHEGPKRGTGPAPTLTIDSSIGKDEQRCLDLVNAFRKQHGKMKLIFSKKLSEVAMPHTIAMLEKKVPLGHSGFNERSAKVQNAISCGENVGYEKGYSDPVKTLVDGWINSPPHRKNMLGDWNQMGIAFAHHGDLWYGTQFFAMI